MSDDREATPEEKRVIVAHDCALEILSLPPEERLLALEAIEKLVMTPAQAAALDKVEEAARLLTPEQRKDLLGDPS
jgi:hypothetical protein